MINNNTMKSHKDIDKYTAKILQDLATEKPPVDFTDKLMDKILSEQTEYEKIEPLGSRKFMTIFSAVFISFFLLVLSFPSGNFSLHENIGLTNNIFSNLQIDFGPLLALLVQPLKESAFLKVLPITIIALIALEQILLKISSLRRA